jgi:RNA polymerase-binding transcription factor DksA
LSERERLDNLIHGMSEASREGLAEMTDELSMYDQHSGDLGSETFEREKDAGLQEMLEVELIQVDEALRKLDQGTYGLCEMCGRKIDDRRLDKLPAAILCITCARASQDKFTRPQEEKILDMHEIGEKGDQFEIAGYDLFDEYGQNESGVND